jgi:hypothetical protein
MSNKSSTATYFSAGIFKWNVEKQYDLNIKYNFDTINDLFDSIQQWDDVLL